MSDLTRTGRVCVVTGSTGAVGSAVAEHMRSLGHSVAGIRSGHGGAPGDHVADLTDEDSTVSVFNEIIREHGQLDILVHTVGAFEAGGTIERTPMDVWDRMLRVNLRSAVLCVRESLRHMQANREGRIVLIGAATGQVLPAGVAAYGISKAAVHHLAEVAAKEGAERGICVNVIAPNIVDTPANRRSMPDADTSLWVSLAEICRVTQRLCEPSSTRSGTVIPLPGGP